MNFYSALNKITEGNSSDESLVSKEFNNLSILDMDNFCNDFARCLKPGDWIFLNGDMGAGKTYFTGKLLEFFKSTDSVSSPTFALCAKHQTNHETIKVLCHLDIYRLKNPEELFYLGLETEFNPKNSIVIIEWASLFNDSDWNDFFSVTHCKRYLRSFTIEINIDDNNYRTIKFN